MIVDHPCCRFVSLLLVATENAGNGEGGGIVTSESGLVGNYASIRMLIPHA